MRIGTRALLIMVPVAVLPLVGAGAIAFSVSRRALEERTRAAQVATARFLAERVSAEVAASLHAASLAASAMEFAQLSAAERLGALRLVFRQIEGAVVVALLSLEGAQIAAPVYLASRAQEPSLADREVVHPEDIEEFARSIPLRAAVQIGAAVGPAHASRDGSPRVAVAVRARGDLVLAVEVSLARLAPLVADSRLGARDWVLAAGYRSYFAATSECVMACTDSAILFCTPTLRINFATCAFTVRSSIPS